MRSLPRLLALLLVAVLALAGCGVRPETPAPTEPSPDATERVRARTVDDALALAADATALAATPVDETLTVVLAEIARTGTAHAAALGGVYDSGLPEPTVSTGPSSTTDAVPTAAELLDELAATTRTAAADADQVPDGALARLLASIATSRGGLVVRLAAAASAPAPNTAPTSADATVTGSAPGPAPGTTTPATVAPDGMTRGDDRSAGPNPEPTGAPGDVPTAAATALALAHDQAAYALEVVAAQHSGDLRTRAVTAAAGHRVDAELWAVRAGVACSAADPRRVAYSLPTGLTDAATASTLVAALETALAEAYATAVAQADAGLRAPLVAGLRTATAAATGWDASAPTFPGLHEQSGA